MPARSVDIDETNDDAEGFMAIPRDEFKAALARAKLGGLTVVRDHGRVVAAIVSPSDYRLIRAIRDREDADDVQAADEAMAEIAEHGTIPWEQVKAELGIETARDPRKAQLSS